MKIAIKAILLQIFWFIAVLFGPDYSQFVLVASLVLAIANFIIFRPVQNFSMYFATLIVFTLFGALHDYSLEYFKLINYGNTDFPVWLLSLYIVFICYYGDIFNSLYKLAKPVQFVIGGAGGISAYVGGAKLANFSILSSGLYLFIFLAWGTFFVLSLKAFYSYKK